MPDKQAVYRPAKQERSAGSEQRILRASQKLFSINGYGATRVADIISEAKCSNGSFYFRFGSKRAVFDIMLERYMAQRKAEYEAADLSRKTHGNIEALLTFYAEHTFRTTRANHGMYRAAQEITVADPDVWRRLSTLSLKIGEKFRDIAHEYADEIPSSDPQSAIQYALQFLIMTGLQTALGAGPLFPRDQSALRAVTVRAALGALG